MATLKAVLLLQIVSTLCMTGLIWFVQVVHYPSFADVGGTELRNYASSHATRTTWVVFPLMVAELGSSGFLLLSRLRFTWIQPWQAWLGAGLVGVIWLSTGLLQVPLHERLQANGGADEVRRLVATNWIRTAAWSGRAVLVCCWACTGLAVR